jgi:hypothetical protein
MRQGQTLLRDWAFLAMAHTRKGQHAEGRAWLKRLPSYKPREGSEPLWDKQQAIILGREVDAVVLYDPSFPADPFARRVNPTEHDGHHQNPRRETPDRGND